jgi:organic hydroperoxide reductase OsmC/OhrA
MTKEHHYHTIVTWTGNLGKGTSDYTAYDRDHTISVLGKPEIPGSSDISFRGKKDRYSPEDSFVHAISACHMLWYLHLCSVNSVVVTGYVDNAVGTMIENKDGSGQFKEVTLKPIVTVKNSGMIDKALSLHHEANEMCFIARSLNFKVLHKPKIIVE